MSNRSHSPPPRRSPSPPRERDDYAVNPGNNLFVTGVALDCTDEELNDLFGKFGKISRSNIMRDPHTRDSRGFAFVSFEDLKCADNARESLNQTEFMGKMLVIDRAKRGAARVPTPGHYYGPIRRGYNRDRPPYVSDYRGRGGYDRGPSRDYDRGYDRNYDSRPPTDRYDRYDSGGYAPPPDRYGAPYDRYRDYNERGPDRYPPRGGGYGDRGASRPPYRDERRYDERPQYDRGPPPPQDRRPRSPPNY